MAEPKAETLTVEGTLVPFLVRMLKEEALGIGPGRPQRLGASVAHYLTLDHEIVGIPRETMEEEVIPYLRDVVYGGAGDKRYEEFVRDYLEPFGLNGRVSEARVSTGAVEQGELF